MIRLLLLVVVFLNFFLALFVSAQQRDQENGQLFGFLGFFAGLWAFSNYLTGPYPELPIVELTYALGTLVMTTGFFWVWNFTRGNLPGKIYYPLTGLALIFFGTSFIDGFLITNYSKILLGGAFIGDSGPGLIVYSMYIISLGVVMIYNLFSAHKKYKKEKGQQYKYVGIGVLITFTVTAISSLIAPLLSWYFLTGLDSIGFFIFLSIIAYTITRHHLFNSKIIATQIFTLVLWGFLVTRIFLSNSTSEIILNTSFFIISIIFGILLVRSVIKEVESREEIERLAKNLEKTNEDLVKANETKSQFLSIASHQFRSPLTAIKGYTSLLLEGSYGELSPEIKEVVNRLYTSTNNLTLIVNDFLDLSRLEQGRMEYAFDTLDLCNLIEATVKEQQAVVSQNPNLTLTFHCEGGDFSVRADEGKIKQVIQNLVDNAIKYTPKGTIKVFLNKAGGRVQFGTKDTGIGIPVEGQKKLFGQFKRAANANSANVMGTGLGLYIAKEIVEAHGGRIWVESEGEGRGSTFTVELPIEQEKESK